MKKNILLLLLFSSSLIFAEEIIDYIDTKEDHSCYINASSSFIKLSNCYINQIKKIEKEIKQKIKPNNPNSEYDLKWFIQEKKKITDSCTNDIKKSVQNNKINSAKYVVEFHVKGCIRNKLATLNKNINNFAK